MKKIGFCSIVFLFTIVPYFSYAQEKDSTDGIPLIFNNNIFKFVKNALTRSNSDSAETADVLELKSEEPFLPFAGKGIRNIIIHRFGFEKTFEDTSKGAKRLGTEFLDHLHWNTREWVIRNNLFFKTGASVDAYQLADNERYLRSLEFIQDARILVNRVANQPDSVDVIVITKDLFTISGHIGEVGTAKFNGSISESNFLGQGQKIKLSMLLDNGRVPGFGYDFQYSKNNIAGTFIHGTAGYTTINKDLADGSQNERGWYLKFDRPLPSAYSLFAGGIGISHFQSFNTYERPDSLFYNYGYNGYDGWLGYNIGRRKVFREGNRKNRYFVSLRYFNYSFYETPYQFKDELNFIFNNKQAVLGQFTFFRQNFYKTNYIYDFGPTEDVPYGYNVAVISGWYKQRDLSRPYVGIDANRYRVTNKGQIIQYYLRSGTFFRYGKFEDAAVLIGSSLLSRLYVYNKVKIRQYFNLSYTRQFNRVGLHQLNITNDFGLRDFSSGELMGDHRISLRSETSFFLNPKLSGFKFAPFLFGNGVLLTPEKEKFSKSGLYYGLGGGVRTRNPNLVFGTIELRCIYFPRKEQQSNSIKVSVSTGLRFRYNNNYVKAPDIIQLNSDTDNSIN